VYKKLEMPPQQLAETLAAFVAQFPPGLLHLEAVQLSRADAPQKYAVEVHEMEQLVAAAVMHA
jgi:hypothetical protein